MPDTQTLVLLVEENDRLAADLRTLAGDSLPGIDWQRVRALDTALRVAHSRNPALVLLSLPVGEQSPEQTLNAWRSDGPKGMPLVVLAESPPPDLLDAFVKAEALGWLPRDERLATLFPFLLPGFLEQARLLAANRILRETVDRFFLGSGFAILMSDAKTRRILQANPQAERLYTYDVHDLTALTLDELLVRDTVGLDSLTLRWLSRQPSSPGSTRQLHRTREGAIRYVESASFPVRLGGVDAQVTTVKDLTDYKQAEEEVRFLQEFNSNLLDHLPFCIAVTTPERRITYQNQTAVMTFGLLVGLTYDDAAERHPGLLPLADQLAALEIGGEERVITWEGRSWSFQLQAFSSGRTGEELVLELARDVTEQIRVRDKLIDAQRMEAVGNLAGGVAHDFNNLLSGILGYANLIQALSEDNDQIVQYSRVIEETCLRASDLTRQLLQFARSKPNARERFDLGAIARYAGKLLRHSVKKEIRLEMDLSSKKLPVQGDPAQVQQMIVNLCLNASDSMSDGTITLRSDRLEISEDHDLTGRGLVPGLYGVVTLNDSGRALDPESTVQLLNPYFAGDTHGEPLSLSLSVALAIARNHDGAIVATGEPKRGVTVSVYLPIARQESRVETEEDEGEPAHGTETILIIDDEEVIRNLMLTSLSRFGYRVLVASGGEEGLNLYAMFKDDIDLVMLDLGLPGIDGRKIFRLIRGINPDAKVVLFTGSQSSARVRQQLMEEGAASWISKPISLKRLSRTMRETLDRDKPGQEAPESTNTEE